jgi:Flp pilus assembly protein protease CpaA
LYGQVLIAASFAVAAYQDLKERAISDLVWIPAIAGTAWVFYSLATTGQVADLEYDVIRVVLLGGLGFAMVYFGTLGEADLIALVFFAADPYVFGVFFAIIGAVVVLVPHLAYVFLTGEGRGSHVIPVSRFLNEQKWIPRATVVDGVRHEVDSDVNKAREEVEGIQKEGMMVEVVYGVPDVLYFGLGYILYLAYLVLFNYGLFSSLP